MSDDRYCPRCGIEWPNFCPLDGQRLNGPWSCSNAQKKAEAAPAPAAPAKPAKPAEPAKKPGIRTPWGGRGRGRGRKRRDNPDSARTVVDAEAMKASAVLERLQAEQKAAAVDSVASHTARTVVQQALTPEDVARARAERAAAAPEPAPKPKAAPPKKKQRRSGFSDTQWFMKGLDVQELADPETGEVDVDDDEYQRDDSISEEERRKFTLRKRGEE